MPGSRLNLTDTASEVLVNMSIRIHLLLKGNQMVAIFHSLVQLYKDVFSRFYFKLFDPKVITTLRRIKKLPNVKFCNSDWLKALAALHLEVNRRKLGLKPV